MRKTLFLLALVLAWPMSSLALSQTPSHITRYVPNAEVVGQGRLKVMLWDVYDIAIYAPQGDWQPSSPYALNITYKMDVTAEMIADRSVEEMRKQGQRDEVRLAGWHTQMKTLFPDVKRGQSLTGILNTQGESVFYQNGQRLGKISDPEFGRRFFDIWLSDRTSQPKLRQALLGR
jgi:hypothetical protein